MGAAHVNASSRTCPACLAQRPSAPVARPGRGGVDGWPAFRGLRPSPPFERVARHRLARNLPRVLINKWQGGAAPAGGAQLPRWGRVRAVERVARNRQTGAAQPPADWGLHFPRLRGTGSASFLPEKLAPGRTLGALGALGAAGASGLLAKGQEPSPKGEAQRLGDVPQARPPMSVRRRPGAVPHRGNPKDRADQASGVKRPSGAGASGARSAGSAQFNNV